MDYKKDYYKILEINSNATIDEIKKSYRLLAKKYHPDICKDQNAELKFKEINEAYEVLSDQNLRQQYDYEFIKQSKEFSSTLIKQLQTDEDLIYKVNLFIWQGASLRFEKDDDEFEFEFISKWYEEYKQKFSTNVVNKNAFYWTMKSYLNGVEHYYYDNDHEDDYLDYSYIYPKDSKYYKYDFSKPTKISSVEFVYWIYQKMDVIKFANAFLDAIYNSEFDDQKYNFQKSLILAKFYQDFIIPEFGQINFEYFYYNLVFHFEHEANKFILNNEESDDILKDRPKINRLNQLPLINKIIESMKYSHEEYDRYSEEDVYYETYQDEFVNYSSSNNTSKSNDSFYEHMIRMEEIKEIKSRRRWNTFWKIVGILGTIVIVAVIVIVILINIV